ncbi:MAG: TadE family protein [Planctomycetota bacterium]
MRYSKTTLSGSRRGASAVEFAIVAPIFFMVILGMIEFGRMMMVQQVITNAAREGARIAVLDSATNKKVTDKVNDYLNAGGVAGAKIKLTPDPPTNAGFNQPVSVSVTVPFDSNTWLPAPFFLGGRVLEAEAVMRRETVE